MTMNSTKKNNFTTPEEDRIIEEAFLSLIHI